MVLFCRLPFWLGLPSDRVPRRDPLSTKPNDPDLKKRSTSPKPSSLRTLLGKHGVGRRKCGDLLSVPSITFGGPSNASQFCNCRRTVRGCTNDLFHCEDWDPREVYSPIQKYVPSTPLTMHSSIPLTDALPLIKGHLPHPVDW
jgi:hypothetical protein